MIEKLHCHPQVQPLLSLTLKSNVVAANVWQIWFSPLFSARRGGVASGGRRTEGQGGPAMDEFFPHW